MNEQAQRIAIAKFCGWTQGKRVEASFADSSKTIESDSWINPRGLPERKLPDYTRDLNAMHEAEKVIAHPEAYASRLGAILLRDKSVSNHDGTTAWHCAFTRATAAQRAEALLRCLGLWEEGA